VTFEPKCSFYLFTCLFIYLFIYLIFIYVFMYLFIYLFLFESHLTFKEEIKRSFCDSNQGLTILRSNLSQCERHYAARYIE